MGTVPRFNAKSLTLLAVGALLAGVLIFGLLQTRAAPPVIFVSLQGKQINMSDLQGKVVLVNFWATSCPGCIQEMPKLINTYQKYNARGLATIAVAMSYDPPNYVLRYAEQNALPFPVALDVQGKIAAAFDDVKLTPTTFLINKHGKIIKRFIGEPDSSQLNKLIESELDKPYAT